MDLLENEPPTMISAKVLSSKRESMVSDNSGELPEAMDTSLPTSFEPGMFKKEKDRDREISKESKEGDKEKRERDKDDESNASDAPPQKKHHHHHNKVNIYFSHVFLHSLCPFKKKAKFLLHSS